MESFGIIVVFAMVLSGTRKLAKICSWGGINFRARFARTCPDKLIHYTTLQSENSKDLKYESLGKFKKKGAEFIVYILHPRRAPIILRRESPKIFGAEFANIFFKLFLKTFVIAIIFTYFLVGWLFDFLKPFDAHCDYLMRMRGMMGTKHDMLHFNHFENTISNFLLKKKK